MLRDKQVARNMTGPTHARFDRNQTHARDERSRLVLGTMRRVTKNVAKGRYKVALLVGLAQDLQLLTPQIVTVHELFCVSRRQQHLDAGFELPRAVGTTASLPRRISSALGPSLASAPHSRSFSAA